MDAFLSSSVAACLWRLENGEDLSRDCKEAKRTSAAQFSPPVSLILGSPLGVSRKSSDFRLPTCTHNDAMFVAGGLLRSAKLLDPRIYLVK